MAKCSSKDQAAVPASAVAAVLASDTEVRHDDSPPWHPSDEFISKVLFDVISSRNLLSGPGNDGQGFTHLQSVIYTGIGREEFDRGREALCRRIVDEPDTFAP